MQYDVSAIASLVGSVFTALSVLFALYVYRRRQDAIAFSSFRSSLIDIRNNISMLSDIFSESALSEIGNSISNQLQSIFPNKYSREDIINILSDEDKRNYIVTAIHLGLRDSKAMKDALSIIEKLNRIPYEHEFQLPLVTEIFYSCIFYITSAVRIITSPTFYSDNILSEDSFKENILPRLERIDDQEFLFHEIAEIVFDLSASASSSVSLKVFDNTQNIILILLEILSRKSDKQLRQYQKKDRKLFNKRQIPDADDEVEIIFQYLNMIRDEFSDTQWDSIVESKTKIAEVVKED